MSDDTDTTRSIVPNAAVALGVVTVGFAAGLYAPPAEAQSWGSVYWNDAGDMQICVCDHETQFCGPCYGS